ncbi:hypothetical protein [uncultured Shimia sp.]|uniref:hypothetical protein n=1 Tax=uncultured Shimia sp. TaxID=573152 RepID=UPI00263651E4|nr:hypothetical protein [uncultured Shimia sp.]
MATKAELEAELARLRAELAARDIREKSRAEEAAPPTEEGLQEEGIHRVAAQTDWETDIGEILSDLEELPHKQPMMFALGAFAVGYLIGRAK